MIVECAIATPRADHLTPEQQSELQRKFRSANASVHLVAGRRYLVYAVRGRATFPWLYVVDEAYTYYPTPYPVFMFSIVDATFPSCWVVATQDLDRLSDGEWLAPEPWASRGDAFFEALVDREPKAEKEFGRMKAAIESEIELP